MANLRFRSNEMRDSHSVAQRAASGQTGVPSIAQVVHRQCARFRQRIRRCARRVSRYAVDGSTARGTPTRLRLSGSDRVLTVVRKFLAGRDEREEIERGSRPAQPIMLRIAVRATTRLLGGAKRLARNALAQSDLVVVNGADCMDTQFEPRGVSAHLPRELMAARRCSVSDCLLSASRVLYAHSHALAPTRHGLRGSPQGSPW